MKRTLILACLLAAALVAPGASATSESHEGWVLTAVAHPAVPRALYLESERLNGTSGFVIPLTSEADERSFVLERTDGATGADDLDAWFYRDILGTGDPCPRIVTQHSDQRESGTVCADAAYAVVVLFAGADASFTLTIS